MDATTTLAALALLATNTLTILTLKTEIKYKTKLWINKKITKKPIVEIEFHRTDKTKTLLLANPKTEARTVQINDQDYQYKPEDFYYNPKNQIQGLIIKEGCASAINPHTWQPGEIDPRQISVALKIQKQRGREEADQSFENYKKYLYLIGIGVGITLILTFLTMQNTDQITTTLQNLAPTIQTLAEKTTGQLLNQGGTNP